MKKGLLVVLEGPRLDYQALCALMSRIEHKYCLISTSYFAGLFDIFILFLII